MGSGEKFIILAIVGRRRLGRTSVQGPSCRRTTFTHDHLDRTGLLHSKPVQDDYCIVVWTCYKGRSVSCARQIVPLGAREGCLQCDCTESCQLFARGFLTFAATTKAQSPLVQRPRDTELAIPVPSSHWEVAGLDTAIPRRR